MRSQFVAVLAGCGNRCRRRRLFQQRRFRYQHQCHRHRSAKRWVVYSYIRLWYRIVGSTAWFYIDTSCTVGTAGAVRPAINSTGPPGLVHQHQRFRNLELGRQWGRRQRILVVCWLIPRYKNYFDGGTGVLSSPMIPSAGQTPMVKSPSGGRIWDPVQGRAIMRTVAIWAAQQLHHDTLESARR